MSSRPGPWSTWALHGLRHLVFCEKRDLVVSRRPPPSASSPRAPATGSVRCSRSRPPGPWCSPPAAGAATSWPRSTVWSTHPGWTAARSTSAWPSTASVPRPDAGPGGGEIWTSSPTPTSWSPRRASAARHETIAIEIIDPRELELPDVGLLSVVDPGTGRTPGRSPPPPRSCGPATRRPPPSSARASPRRCAPPASTTSCCAPTATGCSTSSASWWIAAPGVHARRAGWSTHEPARSSPSSSGPPSGSGCCSPWPAWASATC